jgi:transcriptional regulator with XRE-family HTH domain/Zn-dependent peptidase ImmA (M78 family)
METWDKTDYQRIKGVSHHNNSLKVKFENGDIAVVQIDSLVSNSVTDIQLEKMTYNSFEIIIPAKPKEIEIPWDKIRVIADKEYSKYVALLAEEQAKLVGVKIKRLREKKGIKSFELADRAGITPQTISRIEQGHTDVSFANLRKILAAMGCTLKDLANQELEIEMESQTKNIAFLIKRLNKAGVDSNLLTRKIFPSRIIQAINHYKDNQPELLLEEAVSYVSNIYGWTSDDIWSSNNLILKDGPLASVYFKKANNANINQIKAYSHYAFYLAKVVLKVTTHMTKDYPEDIDEFKNNFEKKYKAFDLQSLLNYAWDMGICVLPLNDSGVFHGASWNIEGKHIIVLKQRTKAHARWIYDLLHEIYHVFVHLDKINSSVIETEELSPFSNEGNIEELEANSFANHVIFGNRAEELAEKCVESANWKLENLKNAVGKISKDENIREDFVSNYIAFRLGLQGQNWWGTASKMQISEPDPFEIATKLLKERISLKNLNPIDYNLLTTAISN